MTGENIMKIWRFQPYGAQNLVLLKLSCRNLSLFKLRVPRDIQTSGIPRVYQLEVYTVPPILRPKTGSSCYYLLPMVNLVLKARQVAWRDNTSTRMIPQGVLLRTTS